MGVYEDLLRRKKIIEDKQGNVTVNAVVNKSVRDKLTDNTIQTYQKDEESNRNAIAQMSNALKNAAKDTIWERMQSIISNKPSSSNFMENFRTNLIQNTVNKDNNKNENIYDNSITNDAKNTFKNLILGGKQGAMQMLKGIETQTEANKGYQNKKEAQFYNSRNVSDMVKAQAKSESNDILNNMIKNKINNNSLNTADYGIGNIDLNNRPVYKNEDGSISTVRSMSFWDDDEQKEILVPTIAFDKDGKAISLTDDEAIDRYYKTGEYLGKFDNYKEADKYAEKLHESQEKIYTNNSDNTIINKSALLKLNDESVKNELDKYKNSISDGKIDTNLTRNYLQNNIDKTTEEIQENTDKINNKTVKEANEQIVPAIGQMGAGMVASAVNPAVGMMYFTESATGGYYDDAKQRGMNDDEARKYSTIMGAMEGATEQIGIENLSKAGKGIKALVKGTGKETIKQGAKEITQSSLKTVLKDYGIGIADNIMQEAIIDPIQELTAQTIAGKDKAQWEGIGQKMLQDGINGGLVSAILGGTNLGIQSCTGIVEKMQNNENVTQQELQTAVKDAGQQLDTPRMMMDSVEQQVNKYKNYYSEKNVSNLKEKAISEIKASKIKEQTKSEMLNAVDSMNIVDENSFKSIQQTINAANKNELQTNATYQNSSERKQNYMKYKNDRNAYDNSAVNEVLEIIPTNRNGNRTVKQWLQVADEIGKRVAGKSNTEIEQIAYKSWFEEQPTKSITKYDNVSKTNVGFQKLTSDDWINTINNAVLQEREKQQNTTQSKNSAIEKIKPTKNKNAPDSNIVENTTKIKGYHGTDENFDNFDLKYFGKHDQGDFGKAVYFSDNENTASKYGKNVKQQDIELNNPYIINTEEDYKQLWSQLAKETDISKLDKTELKLLKDPYTSQEEKNFMLYDKLNSEEKANAIQKLGYDGVIDNTYGQIAVFDTDKINNIVNNQKTLNNTTPKTTIKEFNESAKQYNIDYQNEDLKEIKQMFDKRGIKAYFDDNTFKNNNEAFSVWKPTYDEQGNVSGREVVFNPKAQDTNTRVQELAIHELGHDLDLNEVQNMILKDASKKENWEVARKSLENTYKQAYENDGIQISKDNFDKIVDEEATMSILQRELGNQEYVNRLVNQNQSIAKKIYNWVVDKLNKFTGGKNEKLFWADIRNKFETAYNQEFSKNDSNLKYSVIYNEDGSFNRVKIDDNIFENNKQKSINNTIKDYLEDHINEYANIIESGQKVYLGKDLPSEYAFSKSSQSLPLPNKLAKGRASSGLKEIIENASNRIYEKNQKIKHNIDAKYGFYKYDTKFSFDHKGKEQIYRGTIVIRNDANGKKYLYDITNIKKIGSDLLPVASNSKKSSAIIGSSNDLPINSLSSTKQNVNSKPLQKYSMQESENNSGSFNLQENKKKQLDIIEKNNKMQDDYHTGIRKIEDIKTLAETLEDSDWQGYEEFNPDYTKKMADEALKTGKITVYSSYPIEQGVFVSPSKMEAESYSGNGKVYSKEININDVAWIDPTQGQYANTNQKYAVSTKEWQQFLENNYQKQGDGKNLKEYNLPTREEVKKKLNLPTKENVNTQGESINWNEIERPERKIRKHYKSIIESSNTTKEAKSIAKKLMGTDTYVPETNKSQLAQADTRINNSSPETELKSLMNRATTGGKIEAVDIAVGERLIQYYSKIGDKANLQEAIQATAMAGTNAGRTVQALSMLNHQTPEGQATWIQRSVDKMNNELAKKKGGTITKDSNGNVKIINKQGKDITDKVQLFDLTPEMIEKVVDSKDKQTMYENIDSVYEELGNQVPKSTIEKIDSWRYFSMLANPRTHIRNMVGNVAMGKTQRIKDKLAGGIEGVVSKFNPEMERTKTLMPANSKTKEFAKSDVLNPDVQSMMELNENKYNPQSRLQNARRTFKSDIFEKSLGRLFDWNDKALEAEDALGLKSAYKKALSDYLTANKIDTDKITDAQLSKARNYAVQQAKEATFHQANSIATAINQFSRKNKLTKGATDAVLPFVKTPMNVAKAGLEYNPLGLLKTITSDTVKLRKGNISVNKYIDNLSKGLTGTGIAVLGYALADAGILKASGSDDDKKENYDEAIGKQSYSLQIGDKTYSLDWLAPVGIPLFTGAEAFSLKQSKQDEKSSISTEDNKETNKLINSLENWANGMANAISPMSEMSMISGLTSALTSYQQDSTQMIGSMLTNAGKSYVNQFVPTLLGQTAKTMDKYERSTTSTKTGLLPKAIDQTKLQMMSKIPGLRQKLPTKTDIWGNELKQSPNIRERTFNNFINPATVKNIGNSKVDSEIDNLYNKSGNTNILPTKIDKTYTINGQKYRMTDEEYAKYQKQYGQTSYKLIENLINAKDYKNLSAEQKETAIENIYSYAKECGKLNYAKTSKTEIKPSTLYTTMEDLKKNGGNQSQYLEYIAKTKDITGENSSKQKIGILADSNYSDKTKEIIYKNTEGSKDKKVIVVDKLGLPVNEYLKYKTQKFVSDKDENGDAISGSKKEKVYEYLNNIPDEQLSQDYKKIICKIEGTTNYDVNVIDIVNNKENLTTNERKEILTNLGFKIYENGKIKLSSKIPLARYVK